MPDERRPCQRAVAKVDLTHEAPIARRSARDTLVVENRGCRRSGAPRGWKKVREEYLRARTRTRPQSPAISRGHHD